MLNTSQSLNTDTVFHRLGIKSVFDEDILSRDAQLPVSLAEEFNCNLDTSSQGRLYWTQKLSQEKEQ